ncbi:heavy metal translocating P-type ATPase [Actinomadura kijaniata]|uniref:heavy metal translocating P-type ATPase n=1 Tax=Actinomadura kijaniata TaxID=46161 RepID=UPI003F1CB09B
MSVRTTHLTVEGMTCSACVARVERRLGRLPGVTATVNLVTGRARIAHPASVTLDDLLSAIERAGYRGRPDAPDPEPPGGRDDPARGERGRLAVTALLATPVLVLSMVPALQFRHWQWLCFALAAPVAAWGAWPFHTRAARGLRHGTATMDTLVSLGVLTAFAWSVYALFLGGAGEPGMRMPFAWTATPEEATAHLYLESAAGVTLFVSVGRFLEARARRRTGSALASLDDLAAKEVTLEDGTRAPARRLVPGQRFVVRPGETVAADGVVVEGASAVDGRLVTGEAVPAECGPGDRVTAGTGNVGGVLVVRATAVGADTRLARIGALLDEAQLAKARAQRRADRIAGVFVPAVLVVSVVCLGFWLGAGAAPAAAVTTAIAVLVVACPCALGLAVPLAFLAATGAGARAGVVIGGPRALERLGRVDTVVLDKTGTLTSGRMTLLDRAVVAGEDPDAVLRLAAAVERASEHPVGRAVARAAPAPPEATGFRATPGLGVRGRVEGREVEVVRCDDAGALPAPLRAAVARADDQGHTAVVVRVDGRPVAVLTVGDTLHDDAAEAVGRLRRGGLRPVMATGDRPAAARAVAGRLGITDVHAGIGPEGKAALVAELRARGHAVAVVGDGVNDAPALARADLGVAVAGGTDAAVAAADVTLVRPGVAGLADAIVLARRARTTITTNLVWAFAYNAVTIPAAALGRLNPMLAAVAMSLSSLLVAGNSLRLLRGGRR